MSGQYLQEAAHSHLGVWPLDLLMVCPFSDSLGHQYWSAFVALYNLRLVISFLNDIIMNRPITYGEMSSPWHKTTRRVPPKRQLDQK